MPNVYNIGDVVDLFGTFTDPNTGAPVTPATVVCTVQPPGFGAVPRALSTAPVVGAAGKFTAELTPDVDGTWWYAFDGSGGEQASGEQYLVVRPRQVAR